MNALMITGAAPTMTSLEIADLTGKEHGHVRRDIIKMLELLEKDASKFGYIYPDAYGRDQQGFMLPYDETVCLMTGYDVKARMAVIKRWRELEARATPAVALSTLEILEMATKSERERIALSEKVAADAPAVAFVERYVDSTGLKGFRQVCKLLGAKEPAFREFLESKKIMYKLGGEWVPHAQHLNTGRFEVKAGTSDVSGHAFNSARFTAKGVAWVAGEFAKFQLEQHASATAVVACHAQVH